MAKQKLPKDKLDECNQLIKACEETRQYLALCKECELNVDEEITTNEEQARIAAKIKAKFFPNAR